MVSSQQSAVSSQQFSFLKKQKRSFQVCPAWERDRKTGKCFAPTVLQFPRIRVLHLGSGL
uniref:Uncharacterized protein n=1 Tax=Kuenenia stuttgartiensis TaxID=174633 RepID=Q1Q1B1_KUEST|nr:unknown protein [Candidatus Kuenenia stuttgartiensis]